MSGTPRIVFLVHGVERSAAGVRARGLAQALAPSSVSFLHRAGGWAATWRAWDRQLRELSPDVIYVVNTALPGALLGPWWWSRRRVPFALDTGDAVCAMARSAGTEPRWKWPLLWAGEAMAQSAARVVVVRGSAHRGHLERQGYRRVVVIPDGYTPHTPPSADGVARLRRSLGLEGRFVVGLLGSLVFSPTLRICYGWDLVEALTALRDLPVHGLILGDGPGRAWLAERARALGVADRLTFAGWIAPEQIAAHVRLLDVALSTQTNNLAGQVRTTGKLPEYMAAGRFILASRVGEAARVLPPQMLLDYSGAVDRAYPARLAGRIRVLAGAPGLLRQGASLVELAERRFSYRVLAPEVAALIREVAWGGHGGGAPGPE
jgi:glycosyltransferase involved in cell wall biosynthesis